MKNMVITLMGLFVCGWAQAAVGDTFETGGLTYVVKSKGMVGVSSVESNVTTCTIPANVTYESRVRSVPQRMQAASLFPK